MPEVIMTILDGEDYRCCLFFLTDFECQSAKAVGLMMLITENIS